MAQALSPTAWRRWLALELRRLREAAGLTQKEVAAALRCNVTKVSYMENAQRPVVLRDLNEVLLPLYGVLEDEWDRYLTAARDARKPRWWEAYAEEGAITAGGELYVGLEQGASRQRIYVPQYVPGLLQTGDYARALLRRIPPNWDEEKTEATVELRMRRQVALTRTTDPLVLWAVLDEAALRRIVGGRETMRAQVARLIEMARLPNVTVQLLPFSIGAHHAMAGGFTLLEFAWPDALDLGVVFFEQAVPAGQYVEDRQEVAQYISAFEQLCALGWGPDATVEFLEEVAKEYM